MKKGGEKMPIVTPYQNSRRFVSTIGAGTGTGATFAIAATATTDDTGAAATAFPTTFSYYNLFVNGILQTADTSSVTTTAITIPGGDVLDAGIPITVQFVVS
jgi:ribose 5-phosphate isomerase